MKYYSIVCNGHAGEWTKYDEEEFNREMKFLGRHGITFSVEFETR
jgi:hypothetical protein